MLNQMPTQSSTSRNGCRINRNHRRGSRATHRAAVETLEKRQMMYAVGEGGTNPVHQWLTAEAYVDYQSQFGPNFLDNRLVGPNVTPTSGSGAAVQDAKNVVLPANPDLGNRYLLEGAMDEDLPGQTPFRFETTLANDPSFRHFWEHTPTFTRDPLSGLAGYDSAPDRAIEYVDGGKGINEGTGNLDEPTDYAGYADIASVYNSGNVSSAAWLLGHILHLAQDMTVPAHVQGDPHPPGDEDIYHQFVDYNPNLGLWAVTGQPSSEAIIKSPQQFLTDFKTAVASDSYLPDGDLQSIPAAYQPLYAIFANNASMADDYDTGETNVLGQPVYDGQNQQTDGGKRRSQWQADITTIDNDYKTYIRPPQFDMNAVLNEFAPAPTTDVLGQPLAAGDYTSVQNALANYHNLSQQIANQMMPLAITSSAELIRYFDSLIDKQAPTVNFVNLSDTDGDDPQAILTPTIDLTALSSDQNCGNTGVGINTIKYQVSQLVNGNWTPYQPIAQSGPAASYFQAGPNADPDFYGIAGLASHAVFAGHLGQTYRFQISVEDGAGNIGTDVEYATFKENLVLPGSSAADSVTINKATIDGITWAEINDDGHKSSDPVDDLNEFIFNGGNGNDYFKNNTAIPCSLNGGSGNDTLDGGGGPDTIIGGVGDDTIDGNDGNNVEDGGSGADRFMFHSDYTGTDRVENSGGGPDVLDFSESKVTEPGVEVDLGLSTWQQVDPHLLLELDATPDIKGLIGTPENDTLIGSSIKNAIVAEGGQDTLSGGGAGTTYEGDSGINTLIEKLTGTDDTLTNSALTEDGIRYSLNTIEHVVFQCPNIEDDQIDTSAFTGNETIYGGDKDDHITAGDGSLPSVIYGGPGNDTIYGGNGPDIIDGGPGNDSLFGEGGSDTIQGDDGADYIDGGSGNNSMVAGHDPNDHIVGEPGNPDPAGPPPVQTGQEPQQPVDPEEPYFPDPDYPNPDNNDNGLDNYYETYYGDDAINDYALNRDIIISGVGKNQIDLADGDSLDTVHGLKTSDSVYGDDALHSANSGITSRSLSGSPTLTGDVTEEPLPPSPANLEITGASSSTISLQWTNLSTAYTDIRVDCSSDGSTWTEAATLPPTSTSTSVTNLLVNTQYYFSIRATSEAGASISPQIVARTSPAAPANLRVTSVGSGSVLLAWDASPSSGAIYRIADGTDGVNFHHLDDAVGTTYIAAGLTNGTTFYFEVRAADSKETVFSTYTNIVNATPALPTPLPPSNLRVISTSSGSVGLSWDASATPGVIYRIAYSTDGTNFTHLGDTGNITYAAGGLNNGTTYGFEVRAADPTQTVFSNYTNTVSATPAIPTPAPPSNLRVTSTSSGSVALAWDPSPTPGVVYRIAYSTDGVNFNYLDDTNGTPYHASNLVNGTTYWFEVRAADSTQTVFSSYTNIVSGTPSIATPAAPTNLRVTSTGSGSVTLAWDSSSTPGAIYRLAVSTDGVNFNYLTDTSATIITISGLTNGTIYYFETRAADSTQTVFSDYTNIVTATPAIPAPAAPVNLRVTSTGSGSVTLAWDASSSPSVIYRLADSTDDVNFNHVADTTATSITISGLTNGTTYYFEARAADSTQTVFSDYTNVVTGTPTIPTPAAPANLRVTAVNSGSVTLAWDPSSTPGVIYRLADGTDGVNFNHIADTTATSITISGLTNGTTYYFETRAADSTQTVYSSYANIVNATPVIPTPAAPANLRVTTTGSRTIGLAWDPSSTSGVIYRIAYSTDGVNFDHLADINGMSFTASGLVSGVTYDFEVRAADSTETVFSAYTNMVHAKAK